MRWPLVRTSRSLALGLHAALLRPLLVSSRLEAPLYSSRLAAAAHSSSLVLLAAARSPAPRCRPPSHESSSIASRCSRLIASSLPSPHSLLLAAAAHSTACSRSSSLCLASRLRLRSLPLLSSRLVSSRLSPFFSSTPILISKSQYNVLVHILNSLSEITSKSKEATAGHPVEK